MIHSRRRRGIFLKFDREGRRPEPGCTSKTTVPRVLLRNMGQLTINIRVLGWLGLGLGSELGLCLVCVHSILHNFKL